MKNIKWTHKIHKTSKNTGKTSFKEDWLLIYYFQISIQLESTLLNIDCFWWYFAPMSIVLHLNLTSFFKIQKH